jgi:hypothetical protein
MARSDSGEIDFATARSQLYAVKPADFVSLRADLIKRARAAGDKKLATKIQALRKPTVAAWLVNVLAREPDALAELLALGRELREGMGGLDADGLRGLTRRRHELVTGLVRQARELGAAFDQRVGDEAARAVQATLEATLSDADSADAVAAGCLSEPLEPTGFGGFGFASIVGAAAPSGGRDDDADAGAGATVTDLGARRVRKQAEIAEAEQELADAQALAEQAERSRAEAEQRTADERRLADKASKRVAAVEATLAEARAELAERTEAVKTAERVESEAEKSVRAAGRALASATERLRRLRH